MESITKHYNLCAWRVNRIVHVILEYANDFNLRGINTTCHSHYTQKPITVKLPNSYIYDIKRILSLFEKYKSVFVEFMTPGTGRCLEYILNLNNVIGFGTALTGKYDCMSVSHFIPTIIYPNNQKIKKIKLDIRNYDCLLNILKYFPNVRELELTCNGKSTSHFGIHSAITKLTITDCNKSLFVLLTSFPNVVELNETYRGSMKITDLEYKGHNVPKIYNIRAYGDLICINHDPPEVFNIKTNVLKLCFDNYHASFITCKHISILPYSSKINVINDCQYYNAPALQTLEIVDYVSITFNCYPLEKLTIHCGGEFVYIDSICKMLMFYKPKKCYYVVEKSMIISNITKEFFRENNVEIITK